LNSGSWNEIRYILDYNGFEADNRGIALYVPEIIQTKAAVKMKNANNYLTHDERRYNT